MHYHCSSDGQFTTNEGVDEYSTNATINDTVHSYFCQYSEAWGKNISSSCSIKRYAELPFW